MATTNNLHVYAGNSSNIMDTTDSFTSYEAGANSGDIISSKTLNTAIRTSTLISKALIDAVTKSQTTSIISHKTDATTIKQFIQDGIAQTKVNNAVNATNVDTLTNNDSGNNANVKFTIGDKAFTKTINNVANATTATNVAAITNNDTASNANVKFTIGNVSYSKTIDNVSTATNVAAITNNDANKNDNVAFTIGNKSFSKTVNNVANAKSAAALAVDSANIFGVQSGIVSTELEFASKGWYNIAINNISTSEISGFTGNVDFGIHYINFDDSNSCISSALLMADSTDAGILSIKIVKILAYRRVYAYFTALKSFSTTSLANAYITFTPINLILE